MDVEVKIIGLQELEARLQEIEALGGQKLVRRVLRKIAKPMSVAARLNAQGVARSGALARSIGIVSRRPAPGQVARVAVTSRARDRTAVYVHNAAYNRKRKGIFYGWMVEKGHAGGAGPRPWWAPAVTSTEGRAVNDFVTELTKAITRIETRKSKTASPDSVIPE